MKIKLCDAKSLDIEENLFCVLKTNKVCNKRNPVDAKAINPIINIDVASIIHQCVGCFEILIPSIEGDI